MLGAELVALPAVQLGNFVWMSSARQEQPAGGAEQEEEVLASGHQLAPGPSVFG